MNVYMVQTNKGAWIKVSANDEQSATWQAASLMYDGEFITMVIAI